MSGDESEQEKPQEDQSTHTTFGRGGRPSEDRTEQDLGQWVLNAFFGKVDAGASTFGFSGSGQARETSSATGRLSTSAITGALERYVRPAAYEDTFGTLKAECAVVITGPVGTGKRTGAITMLHRALTEDPFDHEVPIVSLPPSDMLKELAGRTYQEGYGYVVFDRTGERARRDEDRTWQDADQAWGAVGEKVRAAGAYLVVTTVEAQGRLPESVRHIGWERPDFGDALRGLLGDTAEQDLIDAVISLLPQDCPMTELVRIADALADGSEAEAAVQQVLDQAGRREVEEWFGQEPSPRQILEMTVLAFLVGIGDRDFETYHQLLDAALTDAQPSPPEPAADAEAPPKPAEEAPPLVRSRATRLRNNPLIRLTNTTEDGYPRRVLTFRSDGYRRYVLEELTWYDVTFWNAVASWLGEVIRNTGYELPEATELVLLETERQLPIASGLALLSYTYFDEVDRSFLTPWSRGEIGSAGHYTAAYVLWFMCWDEALSPIALQLARDWAAYGGTPQRWTAILAFSGELGVRYPTEAARRLWQLIAQDNHLSEKAARGFGGLFATLTAREGDAVQVVRHLRAQLDKVPRHGRARQRYQTTLLAVLSVLRARNPRTGNPAVMEFLRATPDRLGLIAELWTAVIRHRPSRREALKALLDATTALDRLSGTNAERDAQALGDALATALPDGEYGPLKSDLTALIKGAHRRPVRLDSLTDALLSALQRSNPDLLER